MKLYEIDQAILALVDPETGEILDYEAFSELKMKREEKIEGMALWHKNLTAEATAQGLGTCIIGYFNNEKICQICDLQYPVRLVITLGYAKEGDPLRKKVRKDLNDLVSYKE